MARPSDRKEISASSITGRILRWMQLRFLSGHQLSLFTGFTALTGDSALTPNASLTPNSALTASAVVLSQADQATSDAVILSGGRSPESKNPDTAGRATTADPFSTTNSACPPALWPLAPTDPQRLLLPLHWNAAAPPAAASDLPPRRTRFAQNKSPAERRGFGFGPMLISVNSFRACRIE